MTTFLILCQFVGVCTLAVLAGIALVGAYGLLLWAHRWFLDRRERANAP